MTTDQPVVPASGGLKGRHVLMMLLAFFGVVFTVNGVFLAKALSTYAGVVSKEPYVKGLHYNERIAAGERQAQLGWQETASVGLDGTVVSELREADGRPVTNLAIKGTIGRPATGSLDRPISLRETEPGRYVAAVGPLEPGSWVLSLEAAAGGDTQPIYRLRRRVWLTR
jgi:nitrogen fixation protein FixH